MVKVLLYINQDRIGRLTVVEGVSVLQSSQLLKAGVQDPRPVTRHRQSQRLPVWRYRPRPLLAPVGRREITITGKFGCQLNYSFKTAKLIHR